MKKIYLETHSSDFCKLDLHQDFFQWENFGTEIIYKSDFLLTKELRDFIWKILTSFNVPEKIISRIILVSDELNNNAIEHWTDENWFNKFRIKVEKNDSKIKLNIEVEDNWKWKDSVKAIEMERLKDNKLKIWFWDHNSIRWRWLFLITVQIADKLYFKDSEEGGLIVWVEKELEI